MTPFNKKKLITVIMILLSLYIILLFTDIRVAQFALKLITPDISPVEVKEYQCNEKEKEFQKVAQYINRFSERMDRFIKQEQSKKKAFRYVELTENMIKANIIPDFNKLPDFAQVEQMTRHRENYTDSNLLMGFSGIVRIFNKYLERSIKGGKDELCIEIMNKYVALFQLYHEYISDSHKIFIFGYLENTWENIFHMYENGIIDKSELNFYISKLEKVDLLPENKTSEEAELIRGEYYNVLYTEHNSYQYIFIMAGVRILDILINFGDPVYLEVQRCHEKGMDYLYGRIDKEEFLNTTNKIRIYEKIVFSSYRKRFFNWKKAILSTRAYINISKSIVDGIPYPDPFGGYIDIIRSEDTVKYVSHRKNFNKDAENIVFEYTEIDKENE